MKLLISLPDSSLLVYRNTTDFSIFILCSVTLQNSLISYSSFLVVSLGFSMYTIMSSVSTDTFTSSFPIWIPVTSFSCLIALARTYNTMLNKSIESGHLCLVLDLRGNAFSFSLLSMMLGVGLSCTAFIMLRYASYVPTFWRVFIINGCCIL